MHQTKAPRTDKTAGDGDASRPRQATTPDHRRSPSAPSYSLPTWTGAAYADNRLLFISIGAACVLGGSIAAALYLAR